MATTPKKASTKKAPPPKKKSAAKPAHKESTEQELADNALKLVDQAAALLRKGIHKTADTTEEARLKAKKKAHSLLTKATSSLTDLLADSSSALHKVIKKL